MAEEIKTTNATTTTQVAKKGKKVILNFCATKFLLNLTSPAVHLDKTDI